MALWLDGLFQKRATRFCSVVPAKAGTHNPGETFGEDWWLFGFLWYMYLRLPKDYAVWVPAFAGTTPYWIASSCAYRIRVQCVSVAAIENRTGSSTYFITAD